eukprot:scaffold257157_cov18-Prasinocladus_malaysianus.AAC.1
MHAYRYAFTLDSLAPTYFGHKRGQFVPSPLCASMSPRDCTLAKARRKQTAVTGKVGIGCGIDCLFASKGEESARLWHHKQEGKFVCARHPNWAASLPEHSNHGAVGAQDCLGVLTLLDELALAQPTLH